MNKFLLWKLGGRTRPQCGFVALYMTIAISLALMMLVFDIVHISDRVQSLYMQFKSTELLRDSLSFCKYKIGDILAKNPDFDFEQSVRGLVTDQNPVEVDTPLGTKCRFVEFIVGTMDQGYCKNVQVTVETENPKDSMRKMFNIQVCDFVK